MTSGCRQSRPLLKWKNVLGNVSFKIVNIVFLFANTGKKSANLASFSHRGELHGLSLHSIHNLWSVWNTFLLTAAMLHATIQSYPAPPKAIF
jgi:hypothetical protein